jgi:hypothetical protein
MTGPNAALVIDVLDAEFEGGKRSAELDYETFVAEGDLPSPGPCPRTNGTPSR